MKIPPRHRRLIWTCAGVLAVTVALIAQEPAGREDTNGALMPDWDSQRRERLAVTGERFRTPENFRVEQVASKELVGSVVNMTFDSLGRPLLALEGRGIVALEDRDDDGTFETSVPVSETIDTAHGMYVVGPDELLVHANGPEAGTGLYRIRDWGNDTSPEHIELIQLSKGGIQEHGPHTITRGPDGFLYLLYGNHASPDREPGDGSPLRTLEEDQLLPRYVDPSGHANKIMAPGGTIWRVDLENDSWQLVAGGLRNPFDMAFSGAGELFVHEADMEWDRGLPWFRPTRVLHAIPAGDYGWRTGSGKIQFDNLDTLPGVVDIGRGSPVGVAFYRHDVYPRRYRGAYFMGDWSRGRIRVLFPERYGATWGGELHDFVLGEPLNVTDLDIGPDGHLYFATGGRQTSGGLYRVTYDRTSYGFESPDGDPSVGLAVAQAMPRSAWGRTALENLRDRAAEAWQPGLRGVIGNADLPSEWRQSALELLWLDRPRPRLDMLAGLLADPDPGLRAAAVTLLSTFDLRTGLERLQPAFEDSDPLVRRRAAESLVRMGVTPFLSHALNTELHDLLAGLLDDPDRFVRYAAREALVLFDPDLWLHHVEATLDAPGHGTFEGILALVLRPDDEASWERALRALQRIRLETVRPEAMGDYLRTLELTLIRDPSRDGRADSLASLGEALLAIYPTGTVQLDRKLERLLAYFSPPGAIDALLDELEEAAAQERQIAIAYSLRAIGDGWRRGQHRRMVDWFDRAWQMRGAASMAGYIEVIFRDVLAQLPARRRARAEARRGAIEEERARRVAKLLDASNEEVAKATQGPGLTQMSFEELAEYLEYDVMAYERYDPTRGAVVFQQARCADCHVFGDLGRGGGPDLSTVVSRFRRSEILESIMYPSKVISDQYSAVDVETRGGDFHSGMIVGDDDDSLTLITANGERVELAASNIQSRRESQISLMPEGLLDAMSLSDLMSLIRFLEAGSNL